MASNTTIKNEKNEDENKQHVLESVKLQMEKQYGKGAIMKMSSRTVTNIEAIPSGSMLLDEALGVGGYPKGRIVEIYGPESSGKTTLALHAVAECQKKGGIAAFIDAEHAVDPVYAQKIGVDIDNLWISQPDSGEQALEIAEHLARSAAVDIIVIDSVAALTPQAEIEGMMGDSHMGLQARLMSQALRKLTAIMAKTNCTLIFINQIRMKIGISFGNPETTTGGFALKFYSSIRLEVRKIEVIMKDKDAPYGNRIRVKVVKNKVAPPFRRVELEIIFGKGLSFYADLIEAGLKYQFLEKAGSWYSYQTEKLGQGRDNVMEFFKNNPTLTDELVLKIREKMFPPLAKENSAQDNAAKKTTKNAN